MSKSWRSITKVERIENGVRVYYKRNQTYGPMLHNHVDLYFPFGNYSELPPLKEIKKHRSEWCVDIWVEVIEFPERNGSLVLIFEEIQESSWKFDEEFTGKVYYSKL